MHHVVGHRREDEGGSIAVMAAALVLALLVAGSLAVDVGRAASVSRDQQGATDRAALDSVRLLNEKRPDSLVGAGSPLGDAVDVVHAAALDALSLPDNRPSGSGAGERELYRVDLGRASGAHYHEFELVCGRVYEPSLAGQEPDPPACGGTSIDTADVSAVRLWTHDRVPYVLALGHETGESEIRKVAVGANEVLGSISTGTSAAGLDEGLLHLLLQHLLADEDDRIAARLLSYDGVADATVDLAVLSAEAGVGSIEELLDTSIGIGELFGSMLATLEIQAAQADDDVFAAGIELFEILSESGSIGDLGDVRLGDVLEVDTAGASGAGALVDAYSLALATLQLANATSDPEAECEDVSALSLELDVLGVSDACLNIIEPPVIAAGPARQVEGEWLTVAETEQLQLTLTLDLDEVTEATGPLGDLLEPIIDEFVNIVGGLLGLVGDALDCLNPFTPCEIGDEEVDYALGDLEVRVDLASAETALTSAQCDGDGSMETVSDVTTAGVTIGGRLLEADGEEVSLSQPTSITVGGADDASAPLPGPYPGEAVTVPEAGAPPTLGLAVEDLTGTGALSDVGDLVDPLTDLLNTSLLGEHGVVRDLLDELGVSLGTADVRGLSLDCDGRRLLPLESGE